MLDRVKDFSKVSLNKEYVLLKGERRLLKEDSGIILPDSVDKSTKEQFEEWIVTIVAVGASITEFEPGMMVKPRNQIGFESVDEKGDIGYAVVHVTNIDFAINKDNYIENEF